jgi:hypothetical protein
MRPGQPELADALINAPRKALYRFSVTVEHVRDDLARLLEPFLI